MSLRRAQKDLAYVAFAAFLIVPGAVRAAECTLNAIGQASPAPAASAAPRKLGWCESTNAAATLVDQETAGPGQYGPEAPGFIKGSPLAPNTPYDLFSSAPLTPGIAGIGEVTSAARFAARGFDLGLTTGLGYVRGSVTNASYWAESLMPPINPHIGSRALPYAISFPAHAGEDDGTALRLSILSGSVATPDGNAKLRAGWFDLEQTDRFVFDAPPLTSVNPAIAVQTAESLSPGVPNLDDWKPFAQSLPLDGVDFVGRRGSTTAELTGAELPGLPGAGVRLTMGSVVLERGDATRFSAQLLHVSEGGVPISATVPFGSMPSYLQSPQGYLPSSFIGGQQETMAGLRSAFSVAPSLDLGAIAEIGRAFYAAQSVAAPGTAAPGGYYQLGCRESIGASRLPWTGTVSNHATRPQSCHTVCLKISGAPRSPGPDNG